MKKKVLIFTRFFTPSVKGGGPIRSIENLVKVLNDDIEFYIVCLDRDLGDHKPFNNINNNSWIAQNDYKIQYISPENMSFRKIKKIFEYKNFDYIYLNSFFSFLFSIKPILVNKLFVKSNNLILAPRGEFTPGALSLKKTKKKIYLVIAKKLKLYDNVLFQVTTHEESQYTSKIFKKNNIKIVNNLSRDTKHISYQKNIGKELNKLDIVYLSRIHPMKNLLYIINILASLNKEINFKIYGPIEDEVYWNQCQKAVERLPANIHVTYCGLVAPDKVIDIFRMNHIFVLPTLGENFGHVISESLLAGTPVITSDNTPWTELRTFNAGYTIPLNKPDKYKEVLNEYLLMNEQEYSTQSKSAYKYGKKMADSEETINSYRSLFNSR